MTREELLEIWAPQGGRWSPWAKPVLFAHADPAGAGGPVAPPPGGAERLALPQGVVLVLDLPGATGIAWALAAAQRGFRPVPLHNALPGPEGTVERVPVREIARDIAQAASALRGLALAADAPPAFVLDARRRGGSVALGPEEEEFDNRSVSFPTDFPSGNLLRAAGFERAMLVQASGRTPQPDLAHTLVRWQEAGIAIAVQALDGAEGPQSVTLARPGWPRLAIYRLLELVGLHRGLLGGFGGKLGEGVFG